MLEYFMDTSSIYDRMFPLLITTLNGRVSRYAHDARVVLP